MAKDLAISYSDKILITGSRGFIGRRVVKSLLDLGFMNLRCLVRPSGDLSALRRIIDLHESAKVDIFLGNLLSQEDCNKVTEGVRVVYHLAAAIKDTSFQSSYLNNVVTTENLLNGVSLHKTLQRFVNVSSLAVYSNLKLKQGALLDEKSTLESDVVKRDDAYCNAKIRQEQLVAGYCEANNLSYAILRPGIVYGPGIYEIHRMIGRRIKIGPFSMFLHLGGSNILPLSYVDNCADAIVLAGIKGRADGEAFNVVDDDLPTSRSFLKLYKKNIRDFKSVYIPYGIMNTFCFLWEKCSSWSKGRLPMKLNIRKCAAAWKGNKFSNAKLKELLGWKPRVNFDEALNRWFEYSKIYMNKGQ